MNITENTTVADIAAAVPSSVRVFQRYGIDFCCGGKTPLAVACQERGLPLADLVSAIDVSSVEQSDDTDWNTERLHLLIDHIIGTYHVPLHDELPRLEAMAAKVARVHGHRASHLAGLEATLLKLSNELVVHMRKEEHILFPAIRNMEEGRANPGIRIDAPIAVMEHEHDHAGALLAKLRTMTDGYVAPEWACATLRALYHGLSELEAEMHAHVHLENNILFPRALALARV